MPEPTTEQDEYGQFVATGVIDIGVARAFNAGDAVPASTVKAHPEWVSGKLVAKVGTKAAEQV
jgi:hypothetical protein